MIRPLLTIICLLIGSLFLQAQVTVFAGFDSNKIVIGDHAKLHLEAKFSNDHTVNGVDLTVLDSIFAKVAPSKGDADPGMLEVLEQTEWESLTNAGNTIYRKDVILTCWKEGVYNIPQIRFSFKLKGTNFTRATNKLTLLVSSPIGQTEVIDTVKIAPIKNIVEEQWQFSDFLPLIYILVGLALVLFGVIFIVLYIIRKKQGPPPINIVKRPAHEIAFVKLEQLKTEALWQKGEVKAYQSQLTYIIREYIENRYKVPALESTTGQILKDLKNADFPNHLSPKMEEMLQLADMVKFAKANPPEEMHSRLMGHAEEVVQETQLVLSEEEQQNLQTTQKGIEETFILPTTYAHPGRRFLAYLIDAFFFQIIFSILFFVSQFILNFINPLASLTVTAIITIALFLIVGFLYYVYMHVKSGQTFGKKIMGIQLTDNSGKNITTGKAILRFFIKIFSFVLIMLPFLPILFNKQKQGLHDMVSNSVVINKIATNRKVLKS